MKEETAPLWVVKSLHVSVWLQNIYDNQLSKNNIGPFEYSFSQQDSRRGFFSPPCPF